MSFEVIRFPNETALAQEVARQWLEELSRRDKSKPYSVALSGGRIAKNFFTEVARQAPSRGSSMTGVHFFWADERCVPPADLESNYNIARELLFEPLRIPAGQIHRLRGEADEALALRDAIADIKAVAPDNGKGQPVLDMIFLGMGEDGHVASLFPQEPSGMVADVAIFRAVTAVKPPPRRITLGYGVLFAAKAVWVLASGKGKEDALKQAIGEKGDIPLRRVLMARQQSKVFTDIAL